MVDVDSDGKIEVFKIDWPDKLSKTFFLSLRLEDHQGKLLSVNFYWLSTQPDIQGSKDEIRISKGWGILKAEPKSYADFTELMHLPQVRLNTDYIIKTEKSEFEANVTVENVSNNLAFLVNLAAWNTETEEEILPGYWEDNYFSLLPGEKREIKGRFPKKYLHKEQIQINIGGWNVE